MTIKSIRVLEKPTGRGRLVGPGMEASVSYSLRVTEQVYDTGSRDDPNETIPGQKNATGQVMFADPRQEPVLPSEADDLVLHLADGRKLRVLYLGNGRVDSTGGFF